jgi:hypothetical protein
VGAFFGVSVAEEVACADALCANGPSAARAVIRTVSRTILKNRTLVTGKPLSRNLLRISPAFYQTSCRLQLVLTEPVLSHISTLHVAQWRHSHRRRSLQFRKSDASQELIHIAQVTL